MTRNTTWWLQLQHHPIEASGRRPTALIDEPNPNRATWFANFYRCGMISENQQLNENSHQKWTWAHATLTDEMILTLLHYCIRRPIHVVIGSERRDCVPLDPVGDASLAILTRFHVAVSRYPNRTAIMFDGNTTSYAELLSTVSCVAGRLQREGIAPARSSACSQTQDPT
jgi:hypothetical protein